MTNTAAALEKLVIGLNGKVGERGYRGTTPLAIIVTDGNPTDDMVDLIANADILADRVRTECSFRGSR